MPAEISDTLLGTIILVIALPLLYLLVRGVSKLSDASKAHGLAPLAPPIEGTVEQAWIRGHYRGHQVMVSFSPEQWVGKRERNHRINAFYIEVLQVAGQQDWQLQFQATGWLGQGPKELRIHAQDHALSERLHQSDALRAVREVSAPTHNYVTVRYQAQGQRLTYTDDVAPQQLPSLPHYALQLALVDQLVAINNAVNPIRQATG